MSLAGTLRLVLRRLPPRLGTAVVCRLRRGWLEDPIDTTVWLRGHHLVFHIRSLTDVIQRSIYFTGVYEPIETAYMLSRLHPGAVLVDVGANLGYQALLGAEAVRPAGRVIAVEPVASNLDALRGNLELNGIGNTSVVACAAASSNGTVHFASGQDGQTGWGGLDPGGALVVEGRRLDDVLEELDVGQIDFLKIDVEGGEPEALDGAMGLLTGDRLTGPVMIELNSPRLAARGWRPEDLVGLLGKVGWVDRTPPSWPSDGLVKTRVFERASR